MAINWGTRIVLLYLGFIALIGFLVWKSTHTKVNLVTEDYYAQELVFQKRLDAQNATAALVQKPQITTTADTIIIRFPEAFSTKEIEASLQLYYVPDAALDKHFDKLHTSNGTLSIPRASLPASKYTAKLNWSCDGQQYYQETPLLFIAP